MRKDLINSKKNKEKKQENDFFQNISYINIEYLDKELACAILTNETDEAAGASSQTRALIAGGDSPADASLTDTIEYVTIASLGNAIDFGNLTDARSRVGGCSNSIRGVFACGRIGESPTVNTDIIDYVTIATTGNATDFGPV